MEISEIKLLVNKRKKMMKSECVSQEVRKKQVFPVQDGNVGAF